MFDAVKEKSRERQTLGHSKALRNGGTHDCIRTQERWTDQARSTIREIWPEGVPLRPSVAAILESAFSEDLIIRTVAQLRADGTCSQGALVTVLFGRLGEAAIALNNVGELGDYWHA